MPFTEAQAEYFFGREAEREIISANLQASRLTLLYGPSGVGKSSVINAGVVHELRAEAARTKAVRGTPDFAVIVFYTWRDDPMASLEAAIAREVGEPPQGDSFAERIGHWTKAIDGDLLVILDQFEEYFLYHSNADGPGTFAVEFPNAVNRRDLRVSFLVSMREDSIAKLDLFKGRIPNLFDNYLRIDHLERDQARDAIVKPLERYNQHLAPGETPVTVEPALVETVLNQVTTGRVAVSGAGKGRLTMGGDGSADQARVETPYLQLVMTRLWHEEVAAGSHVMRLETLTRLQGAGHIVATHLDAALDALTDPERSAAAAIFQFLVTPSGTKIALTVDDLAQYAKRPREEIQSLLLKLSSGANRILIPVAPPPDQPARESYQIFHDVLAAAVLEWRTRYARQVEQAASAIREEEQRRLAEEQRQRAEHEARAAAELRRQKRQLTLLLIGTVVLLAAVGVLGYVASTQKRQIQKTAVGLTAVQKDVFQGNARVSVLLKQLDAAQREAVNGYKEAQQLLSDAAVAARAGDTTRAAALETKAAAVRTQADAASQSYTQINSQIQQEQQVAAGARQRAEDLAKLLPTVSSVPPLGGGVGIGAAPPAPAPAAAEPPPVSRPTTPKTGSYKDSFRRGIVALNRKQFPDAKKNFDDAIADLGVETGESINISGFGNNQPYLPKYFLGIALRNLGDCTGALRVWAESERDGAIMKTNLSKSLAQERAKCQ
jgi:hypothetical protein